MKTKTARRRGFRTVPSERFHQLVAGFGGIAPAARIWGIEFRSLERFMKGSGSLSLTTAAAIARKTGVDVNAFFTTEGQ